jgi:nitrate reductase NapAB chaperone NapD
LVPRNARAQISTNKNVKLRMGYSMQSVLVNSTSYEYRETGAELIQMVENGVRTLDKYGKVIVILEESQQ